MYTFLYTRRGGPYTLMSLPSSLHAPLICIASNKTKQIWKAEKLVLHTERQTDSYRKCMQMCI